jgi:hypothetical protein
MSEMFCFQCEQTAKGEACTVPVFVGKYRKYQTVKMI